MDAGAKPNASDFAGNYPMDLVFLRWSQRTPCPYCSGTGGCSCAVGDSIVLQNEDNALSLPEGGADGGKNWKGVAEALAQYGGRRRRRSDESRHILASSGARSFPHIATSAELTNDNRGDVAVVDGGLQQAENLVLLTSAPTEDILLDASHHSPTAVVQPLELSSIALATFTVESEKGGQAGGGGVDERARRDYIHPTCSGEKQEPADDFLPLPAPAPRLPEKEKTNHSESFGSDHEGRGDGEALGEKVPRNGASIGGSRTSGAAVDAAECMPEGLLAGKKSTVIAPGIVGADNGRISSSRTEGAGMGAGGEREIVGIPCTECLLPKVVMVRALCCRGLICKPCVRGINLRRQSCRRCRGSL